MASIHLSSMVVTVRRIGWLGLVQPWRSAMPAIGERIIVEAEDLTGCVFSLGFPKGPPRICVAYLEDRD